MPGSMCVTYRLFEDVVEFLKMDHRVASVSQSVVVVSPFRLSVKGPAFVTRGRLIGSHSIGTCYRGESRVATEDSDAATASAAAYAAAAEATRPPSLHPLRPPRPSPAPVAATAATGSKPAARVAPRRTQKQGGREGAAAAATQGAMDLHGAVAD